MLWTVGREQAATSVHRDRRPEWSRQDHVRVDLALKRIAGRVKQGGHDVSRTDVVRRFNRGAANFERVYRHLADAWAVYDNSQDIPRLLETWP